MPAHVFKIQNGKFGLSLVDTAATNYSSTWQAPGGKLASAAKIADYTTASGGEFTCQITSGALSASPNTTDETTPATFCGPEEVTTNVGVTSYTLDLTFLQDPDLIAGISAYLYANDTKQAYFYIALANDTAPKAIGRCRLIAGTIGGDARTNLTATLSMPCDGKPDVMFGSSDSNFVVIEGGTQVTITASGATPTGFTPPGATPPFAITNMTGITASPNTAWTTGQSVTMGNGSKAYWNGTAWTAGTAP